MLTQEKGAAFDEDGLVSLPGAVPRGDALRMAGRIREFLTSEMTRTIGQHEQVAEHPGGFQPLKRAGAFDSIGLSRLPEALDELFGEEGWERPRYWGTPLVTYEVSAKPWDVPTGSGWHIHERAAETGLLHRVTVFVVLNELHPRGGGTLILTGSHRLIARFGAHGATSRALRKSLGERDPWLADLWGRREVDPTVDRRKRYLLDGAVIDGVPMRVVEVTGQPGDAFVMRSDTFHARSLNTLRQLRIMLVGGVSVRSGRRG